MLVCFVSLMHILWGVLLLYNGGPIHIAATWAFVQLTTDSHYACRATIYILSGLLPLLLLWRPGSLLGLVACGPQLLLLIFSGISAVVAIANGRYADGTERGHLFIAADQGIYILLAILYVFETLDRYTERKAA